MPRKNRVCEQQSIFEVKESEIMGGCRFESDCTGIVPDSNNHCTVNPLACRDHTVFREKARRAKAKGQQMLVYNQIMLKV